MYFGDLNDLNFTLFAAKAYCRPGAVASEFEEDVQRLLYLKRCLTKYYTTGVLKDRLVMNHLVVLYNVFGLDTTRMLFAKLDERDLEVIKPFLMFLKVLPEKVYGVNGCDIDTRMIRLDEEAIKAISRLRRS